MNQKGSINVFKRLDKSDLIFLINGITSIILVEIKKPLVSQCKVRERTKIRAVEIIKTCMEAQLLSSNTYPERLF